MAKHTLLSWLEKWAAPTGRFRDNSDFEIAEDDYRELSQDIGDTFFLPIDELLTRVDKLENPAPEPVVGVSWVAGKAPKVSVGGINGTDVIVTNCEGEFDGVVLGKTAGVVHQAPKPQEGTTRVDILAATSGPWVYIYGEEDGVTPRFEHPTDPTIKLLFAAYLIWTSAGAVVEEPMNYVRTVDNQLPDPNGNINTDFSRHAAYTAAPAGTDISAWQKADGTKGKLSWSQLKAWIGGGSVDTVNTVAPDAGTKNITLTSANIDNTVNDSTWWGTASLKIKGALDYLANKIKTVESALAGKQATLTFDNTPTANSPNPATSGGIKSYVDAAVASGVAPAKESIVLASGVANITINTENPAEISANATPTSISVDSASSLWGKGRVLRIVANGSAEPTISGATKYPGDSGSFVTTSGTQNRLWFSVLPNNAGTKTVYYIWR